MARCGRGGIGEALVKEYARCGLYPIATVLPSESSEHLDQAGIQWFPLDVTVEESVIELKRNIASLTGGFVDILVNNAWVQSPDTPFSCLYYFDAEPDFLVEEYVNPSRSISRRNNRLY